MPMKIPLLSRTLLSKPDASPLRPSMWPLGGLSFSLLATATGPATGSADSTRYLNDIKTLSAPDMEGRGAGAKGLGRATKYLEHRYKGLGLQPAGTNGYLQPFTVTTGAKLKSDNEFIVDE